ncbi:protein cordon-bleu isoform X3 [Cynoglossus semilaevis]|uniref:Cordon-bleu WH2 repeat protein n=1 Tax=Cynoglossus semilaevis TaxID=244447 RepID=A0A3P8VQ55_CYNSE|nr:protein cordon-bleu isoform X3 [Cynoglossus semilaevis]
MSNSFKPPLGKRMKGRAPLPPQVPQPSSRHIFRKADGEGSSGTDVKENMLKPTVNFKLTLPQGYQTYVTEQGSKALMDLLVELCSRHHLNPALHTLELLSSEGHPLGFKPNALLGSLNVACVFIKEKGREEKVVSRPAPRVPEKTVRLMVNFHGTQKAILRVNPSVPLEALTPVICDKCELDPVHVLFLKDNISRQTLPLEKSLSDLGIKELYVHDKSQDDSCSRTEKKGLLGIFQFSRKKNKTSVDMDDCDDKAIEYPDTNSNGLSYTLGQSQSVTNVSKMSPKAEIKKRRAPAPPEAMTVTSCVRNQIGLAVESQQRKRKAPGPPPNLSATTLGSDDISASASPHYHTSETPTSGTKSAESVLASSTIVIMQTIQPVPTKTPTQPTPTSSPSTGSSTTDSLAVQDSSSENDVSDDDLEMDGSQCSTLTSSTASGSVQVQPTEKSSSYRMEKVSTFATKSNQDSSSASSSRSETESALNLKMEEVENNRQSATGTPDQQAPPKPRRCPTHGPLQHVPSASSTPPPLSPPIESTGNKSPESPIEMEETAPQSWLHSMQSSAVRGHNDTETPEEETVSLNSSSGSSLPDQGYAASEGMAEGEDSGIVSSPTDTQPTSPDGSLSLDGNSGGGGERLLGPVRDNSSDSDEGCATWGSRCRHNGINLEAKCKKSSQRYENDPNVTAKVHQTLVDFEAGLSNHIDIASFKEASYNVSTDSNEVPVSVVDMDVPVTAIDEVLEDYEMNIVENEGTLVKKTISAGSKGPEFSHKLTSELKNKNNNAHTANDSSKKKKTTKQPPQLKQHGNSPLNKSSVDKEEDKILEIKSKARTDSKSVKEDKGGSESLMKSHVDRQKHSKRRNSRPDGIKSDVQYSQERKPVLPLESQITERVKESHSKITQNVSSRFGMKTFTVVPPKPSVIHDDTENSLVTENKGAIKIDDQGNMVKVGTNTEHFGGLLGFENNGNEQTPLLGKAKAFWSVCHERQESLVAPSKSKLNKTKEITDEPRSTLIISSDKTWRNNNTEHHQTATTKSVAYKPTERVKPADTVKEETKVSTNDIHVAKELKVEGKTTVSKNIQQPSNKSLLPAAHLPDLNRDLSFLKPAKRTSSHYVASAINKYTPQPTAKPNPVRPVSDFSVSVKNQSTVVQRSARSIQVNPHQSSQSDNKQSDSTSKPDPPCSKRSISYPEYMSDGQRDFKELNAERGIFRTCAGSSKESVFTLETETVKNKQSHYNGLNQIEVTANNDRDNIRRIGLRSAKAAPSSSTHSPVQPHTASQNTALNDTKDTIKVANRITPDDRSQPSVTVSDNCISQTVTVFGPIKKFRPVICRSVEKETSLHSSLMEAIQTGGGKDRLKKISTSGSSCMKKHPDVEDENERSALLAAIRAQSSSDRLRKTKCEAADELDMFRKTASLKESISESPSSPSPSSASATSTTVCTAPLPAAPPPPPHLSQGKPNPVGRPSVSSAMNPAMAREAMLEAIRSGSAAEKLKKVAAPTKTVQVNGRLGTMRATSPALPEQ